MADIKLRIEVNPNAESGIDQEKLGSITNNEGEISNTSIQVDSTGKFVTVPETEFSGSNGLTWAYGYIVFNEDGYLDNVENSNAYLESEQSPDQFFWGAVPESKEYRVKLTFSNASNLKDIVIYGDKTNNQFPTEAIIDGETVVTSDDVKWAINLLTESDTHTIEFTKWNRANYNATITLIRIMLKYWEVDKFNGLKSVESLSQITGQPQDIFYGVVPSDGSAQIIDINGDIYDMVNDGVIPNSNLRVELFANGRKVQQHITEDTKYDNTQILEIAFTNSLSNWDNIKFTGMKLREQTSLYEVLKYILTNTNYINESSQMDVMLDNKVYYEGLYIPLTEYLQNIIIPYPYLESSSLREAVDKVCALAQLNVVENEVGEVKFISARPIIDIEKPIIKVTTKEVKSKPYRDVILKNKYRNINVLYDEVYMEYRNVDTRNIVAWEERDASGASESDFVTLEHYNNMLGSNATNPTITVLANNIPSSSGSYGDDNRINYFNIFKYDIFYDYENVKIKNNFNHRVIHSWNFYIPNQEVTFSNGHIESKNTIYSSNVSDDEIISQWAYIQDGKATSVKTGINIFDYALRKNNNNSLTLFAIEWNNVSIPLNVGGLNLNKIVGIYKDYSYDFQIENLKTNEFQTLEEYDYSLQRNELMQNGCKIYSEDIIDYLAKNISRDYGDGIATAEIEVVCSDLYDIYGNKVKDWVNGETYKIGDIIRVDKDKDGNSLWNYKDGNPMYWQIIGRNFKKVGVPTISLKLRECKFVKATNTFETHDWQTITQIANAGDAEKYYNIGDEKTIKLSTGEEITLQILGFNHDSLTNGGKANITFGMKNILLTSYQMNTTNTNAGGWKECYFRNTTLPEIFNQLPIELQGAIKLINKECSLGDGSGKTELVSDKLFLFSETEIFKEGKYSSSKEGNQYEYWNSVDVDNNRYLASKSGAYWLRSPSDSNYAVLNRSFSVIDRTTGDFVSAVANNYLGICLGFCI